MTGPRVVLTAGNHKRRGKSREKSRESRGKVAVKVVDQTFATMSIQLLAAVHFQLVNRSLLLL
jgi:hypothetical protein